MVSTEVERIGEHVHVGGAEIRILSMSDLRMIMTGVCIVIVIMVMVMVVGGRRGHAHDHVRDHGFRATARRSPD